MNGNSKKSPLFKSIEKEQKEDLRKFLREQKQKEELSKIRRRTKLIKAQTSKSKASRALKAERAKVGLFGIPGLHKKKQGRILRRSNRVRLI